MPAPAPTIRRPDQARARLIPNLLGAVFVIAGTVATVIADGIVLDAHSARSAGRGGANLAHADNPAILLENPAALANIAGKSLFGFGSALVIGDLEYSDPQNSGSHMRFNLPENPSTGFGFAYMTNLAEGPWSVGFGVFTPAGFGTDFRLDTVFAGRQQYRSLNALVKILPAVAYEISDRLAVGASFGLAVNHAEIQGPLAVQTGLTAGLPTLVDVQSTDFAPTATIGLQYDISDRTRLGFAFSEETRFRGDDGEGSVRFFTPQAPEPIYASFDAQIDVVYARTLGMGVRHRLGVGNRVSADLIWFDWSHAFDRLDTKLTDVQSSNPIVSTLIRDRTAFDWHDSVSIRLGYEHDLSETNTVRVGYVHHRNPVPDSTLTTYIPAIVEHDVTVGFTRVMGNWTLDVAYLFAFGDEATVGASRVVGGDFDSSTLDVQYHLIFVGLSLQY